MTQQEQIAYLLRQYTRNTATPEEQQLLMTALRGFDYDEEELLQLLDEMAGSTQPAADYDPAYWQPTIDRIVQTAPVVQMYRRRFNWKTIAVAASVLIALATTWFVISTKEPSPAPAIAKAQDVEAPKNTKATITLADGRIIAVDSVNKLKQGDVTVSRSASGNIVYSNAQHSTPDAALVYNTLSNPRGSTIIDMVLGDGSHVWLNAGSSITYPTAFTGPERKVSISGEAYFSVTHNARQPFRVEAGNQLVEDIGTSFNVNAYPDEATIKTTLLEGSVKVSLGQANSKTLKPGQQAVVAAANGQPVLASGSITVNADADIDQAMAWKNGLFQFTGSDLETVMRQISRWYDVDIVYEKGVPGIKLGGEMKRDLHLSQVLKGLGQIGVHFRIEGKKLLVLP